MTVIVTGAAGFVGMHVAERLLQRGETVAGVGKPWRTVNGVRR